MFRTALNDFLERQSFQSLPAMVESRNDTVDYDVVVIGSSLVHLTRAATLSAQGYRVLVVEEASRFGGVWSAIDILGFSDVERAPHIFMPCRTANDFYRSVLNAAFEPLAPVPVTVDVEAAVDAPTVTAFPNKPQTAHPDVLYDGEWTHPIGGGNSVLKGLLKICGALGVTLRTEASASKIELRDDLCVINVNDTEITARSVSLSRGSPITHFRHGDSIMIPAVASVNASFHFLMNTDTPPAFSFAHIDGHPTLKEIQDITSYTGAHNKLDQRQRLIVGKMRFNLFNLTEVPGISIDQIFNDLKTMRLISPDADILDVEITGYRQNRLTETAVRELVMRGNGRVEILPFHRAGDSSESAAKSAQDVSVLFSAPEFYTLLTSMPSVPGAT